MLTRAVAVLIAASAITASVVGGAQAAPAEATGSEAPPAGCGAADYPAAYGIWCPGRIHLVVPGDNLWELAQAYLGNGHLWPEIYILGRSRPQPCRPALISPGQILLIPSAGLPSIPGQAGQPGSCPPARDHGRRPRRPGRHLARPRPRPGSPRPHPAPVGTPLERQSACCSKSSDSP